ncbi:MAG: hypothetical protein EXS37_21410 [Opitutus sp.]|nr:hypothetical protein [Opitutus sp.]
MTATDAFGKIADLSCALAALPDDAPDVEWGRLFVSDRATRSVAPGFTITPAEAEKFAKELDGEPAASATPAAPARIRRRTPSTPTPAPAPKR